MINQLQKADLIRQISNNCRKLILNQLELVIRRYKAHPDYGWIDTKYDPVQYRDFPEDSIHGRDTIYGWIQGRGLESLAGHAMWLGDNLQSESLGLLPTMRLMVSSLAKRITAVNKKNNGHCYFFMSPEGVPFKVKGDIKSTFTMEASDPYNYSDLFCAKGMYWASVYLGDKQMREYARKYCYNVISAVRQNEFISDQQPLDPKNPCDYDAQKRSHGPHMISTGMACLLASAEPCAEHTQIGIDLIRYVLCNHSNSDGKWPAIDKRALLEFIDPEGMPYKIGGAVLFDPGHAMEFVGLSLKFIDIAQSCGKATDSQLEFMAEAKEKLFAIFEYAFEAGFQHSLGFCKLYDLRACQTVNGDMPWWSLPEAMRAAVYVMKSYDNSDRIEHAMYVLEQCYRSLFDNYVIRHKSFMTVVQTISIDGNISASIPATADIDPGYHTGLPLVDCMNILVRDA